MRTKLNAGARAALLGIPPAPSRREIELELVNLAGLSMREAVNMMQTQPNRARALVEEIAGSDNENNESIHYGE